MPSLVYPPDLRRSHYNLSHCIHFTDEETDKIDMIKVYSELDQSNSCPVRKLSREAGGGGDLGISDPEYLLEQGCKPHHQKPGL